MTTLNGTDALLLAFMAWGIGPGDAVFVPDFTFFASGEAAALRGGGVPVFVDVEEDSFNMSADSLGRRFVKSFMKRNWFQRRLLLSIFLDSRRIMTGSAKLRILTGCSCWKMARRDSADGLERKEPAASEIFLRLHFSGKAAWMLRRRCAVFTDNDEWADLIRSYDIHGKRSGKYDNVRIGINSRLDTLQAAVLMVKLQAFQDFEMADVNQAAERYHRMFQTLSDAVQTPVIKKVFFQLGAVFNSAAAYRTPRRPAELSERKRNPFLI